jgi:glycosyltransferase involved in cell wall biosynthesis
MYATTPPAGDRVLIVANWDWVIFNFRLPLAAALVKAGYDVTIVCPQGIYVDRIRERGFRVELWRLTRRSINPFAELLAVLRLRSIYMRLLPAVVHHFTLKPSFYGSIAAFSMRSEKPQVINTFTGLGFIFSRHGSARVLRNCVMPLLRPSLGQKTNWTVFQNSANRERFLVNRMVRPDTSRVIAGSGVDTKHFHPVDDRFLPSPKPLTVIFTAARLLWDKGIAETVEAAQILRGRKVMVEFWIAGAVDEGNLASIPLSVVTRWEKDGLVRLLGHRDDIRELLQQANLALLASEHEGLPRFLLEAAACGLPLIATDIPGCRTIVRNGINGVLIPVKSAVSIADAIGMLLADPERMHRYSLASRSIAEQNTRTKKSRRNTWAYIETCAPLKQPNDDNAGVSLIRDYRRRRLNF